MTAPLQLALLLLTLGFSRGLQPGPRDDYEESAETERVFAASKYGSLWPLPQKVKISDVSFKLTGVTFRITDAKGSSSGASCSLLQNAYRR